MVDHLSLQGGAERLALMIAGHLDPSSFESSLCVTRWPPTHASYVDPTAESALACLRGLEVPLVPLHRRRKIETGAWTRLASYLRTHRIDVLHTHKFGSNVWGTLAGRAAKVPVILAHEHTWSYEGQPLRRALDRHLIAKGADRFLAVSSEDRRRMIEIERVPPGKAVYVPNGILVTPPTPGRDLRAELGIAPDAPVIGVVAVLRPQKALGVLLEAVATLVPEQPDLRVVIAGDGPERGVLEERVDMLSLTSKVCFLGARTDVSDVLGAFDVAVCCSDFEGSPLAVMEYMAAGLPIVATAVGGVPDLIATGVHGLLVPPRDPPALAAALRRILSDRDLAAALGEQARARQRSEFELGVLVRRLEALYTELLATQRASRAAA